jgi:hypothetical protein
MGCNETTHNLKGIQMSKIYFDVYAIKLTEENISQIEAATRPLGWTLDHLQDSMELNAEDGFDTILYMKLYRGTTEIATFSDEEESKLDPPYCPTAKTDPKFGIFYEIEKI